MLETLRLAEVLQSENYQGPMFTYQDLVIMEKVGIISEDEHIELLEGQILKITISPPHAMTVSHFSQEMSVAFYGKAGLFSQSPLRISDNVQDINLPQPDLMLTKETFYLDHPRPKDVYLLIEVSDSTLKKDKLFKLPLYAQAGIPEVWIVNLIQRVIEVYDCTPGEAQLLSTHDLTAALAPRAFPDISKQWLPQGIYQLLDKFKL